MFSAADTVLFCIIFAIVVPLVESECCCRCTATCHCFEQNWPWQCGGTGGCNAFCCACDGACRNLPPNCVQFGCLRSNANVSSVHPKERFSEFDTDADGFLTLEEVFEVAAGRHKHSDVLEQFAAIDADGDKQLSYAEFEQHA